MTKKSDSLAKVLVLRVGIFKASQVMSFLVTYSTSVIENEGRRVSLEEFADQWGMSPRTAYRDLDRFRAALPEFDHPHDLAVRLIELRAARSGGALLDLSAGALGLA